MSATRLPLLCAFAGGCLSGAILLGVWRADAGASAPVPKQATRPAELVTSAVVATSVAPQRGVANDAVHEEKRPPAQAPSSQPAILDAAPTEVAQAPAVPAGSAVSDVLMDLEAAYRQRLIAAARAEASAASERAPSPVATDSASASAEQPREVAARAAAPATPVAVVAVPATPPPVPPPPAAPAPVAVAALAAPVAAAPALASPADSRPTAVHFGDGVHFGDVNNTYVTNVRQGDVYVVQQQIAMMQYMQLLGASAGLAQPTHLTRGVAAQRSATPQFRQFPSTLTNPDNPWGFNFAPPNLVH